MVFKKYMYLGFFISITYTYISEFGKSNVSIFMLRVQFIGYILKYRIYLFFSPNELYFLN